MREAEVSELAAFEKARTGVVKRLRAREDEIEEAIFLRIRSMHQPTWGDDSEYETGVRAAVAALVPLSLTAMEERAEWTAPIPAAAIAQAQRAARRNVSMDTMLLRYIAAHRVLGAYVMDEANRSGLSSNGPALRHLRTTQEELLERLTIRIADEYKLERERMERSPDECHAELVQRLLAGERPDTSEIDYELDEAWHLGVIASGPRAKQAVRELANGLGRQLLFVSTSEGSVWAWIGGRRELDAARLERFLAPVAEAGVSLVLGEPRWGIAGWRLSHQEAQAGLLVALRNPQPVTHFADHALVAIVLQNQALARSLTDIYLPPLSIPVARETLRAYFSAGRNAATAAAKLGINRHTVERRLRAIETKLGRQLQTCQAELEVALRLEELGENTGAPEGQAPE